jgi:ectoine hydroxylase-related dioxygenase (phytanoyl-CoA dioxygenase family)
VPDIPNYGVKLRSTAVDDLDGHAEELRLVGYTVIDSGLAANEVAAYRDRTDEVIRRQEAEAGGPEALARIGDANTGRALLAYDPAFLTLATNPRLLGVVGRLLGDYFVLSQQNSISLPPQQKHEQAQYHRDLPYQHFVSSHPIAVNALFCVDGFTLENGATQVVPGSHKYEPFPSARTIRRLEQVVVAPAGSFIVLDAMMFHRGGINLTAETRRGVNHVFVLPFIRQQIDLPSMLGDKYAADPALRRLLGYDVQTAISVHDWRARRRTKS